MHGEAPLKIKAARKQKQKIVNAVDLFCGAGGTSTGLVNAVNDLGYEIKLTAINHWDVAIATHTKNHENVAHHCQSIDTLDPCKIVPGGRLQLLVASPECTHHSRARGGKPRSDQKRADAWLLMRWIEKLYVENILIENVKEFIEWGPLTAKGVPDKRHKGEYFRQFVAALKINYNVEYRVLNCADYGDPTTRERFFLIARRGHKKIVWPARTHASRKELAKRVLQPDMFDKEHLKPWVPARQIIDWSLEGKSIFGRKKPLSPNTMRRIYAGLEKYSLKPFTLVPERPLTNRSAPRDIEEPVATVTGTPRIGVVEPFLVPFFGERDGQEPRTRDINEPAPTVTTHGRVGVCEPFIIPACHGKELRSHSVDDPLRTVVGSNMFGVVEPFIVPQFSSPDTRDIDEPVPTLPTTSRGVGVVEVEAFMLGQQSGATPRSVDDPEPTVAAKGAVSLVEVEPFIFNMAHTGKDAGDRDHSYCKSTNEPISTIAGKGMYGVVEPFLVNMKGKSNARGVDDPTFTQTNKQHQYLAEPYIVKFYGNEKGAESVEDPLATVTAKDRFGLCIPSIGAVLDIRFRMLQPHELAAAMSFPADYEFTGNRENKVKQIGNAVPLRTAKALCRSLLV